MKYYIALFALLLTTASIQAQEVLLPLHQNPTQRLDDATHEKGYRPDFSRFCRAPESITFGSVTLPTCLLSNGTITVQTTNLATPYNVTYTGTGTSNSGTLTNINEPQFTLTGLKAGAFFIVITDADGRIQYRYYELNNDGAEPTVSTHWEIIAPFCNELGKLKKRAFTPGAVGEFKLFDSNHVLIANYTGSTQISTSLPQGTYYLQRQESAGCRSFYIFEVVPVPTIAVPFTDDFSTAAVVPDSRYWQSGCVLINDSYAWQPFTMGVATFDGLNCEGQPYQPVPTGANLIDGYADVLTSRAACVATSSPDLSPRDTITLLSTSIVQLSGIIATSTTPVDITGTYYWINNELHAIESLTISGTSFVPLLDSIYRATDLISLPDGTPLTSDMQINLPNYNIITSPEDIFNLNGNLIEINGELQAVLDGTPPVNGIIWDLPTTTLYTPATDAYLNFLYQPKGLGDHPNEQDSLMVEILTADTTWRKIWSARNDSILPFRYVSLRITDSIPTAPTIWDGFRFRFRNTATVSGNNDHWNIDYVQLRPNTLPFNPDDRAFTDLDYNDSGFSNNPPSMLSRYQSMPWKHFWGHTDTDLKPQVDYKVGVINTTASSDNRALTYTLKEICSDAVLFETSGTGTEPNDLGNFTGTRYPDFFFRNNEIADAIDENPDLFADKDSVILENRLALSNDPSDEVSDNDTTYAYQKFFNYFAYDDGVAEKAYGLYGIGSKLAARFYLNEPDTLRAIQIAFVSQNQNIENLPFKLAVWKSVQMNSNNAQVLYQSSDNYLPQFIAQPNGLWTYMLEQPLPVSDTIYVGFIQSEADFLPVAFDVNNTFGYDVESEVNSEIFYNTSGHWYNSLFQGALLMRPVVGAVFNEENVNVGIQTLIPPQSTSINLYPNPTDSEFFVQSETAHTVELYDVTGRLIIKQSAKDAISVSELSSGIYLARVYDVQGQVLGTCKAVVK